MVIDPPKARQMFEGLHPRNDWEYQLHAHWPMATAHARDTLFINHAAALRGGDMDVQDTRTLLGCDAGRIVCALRVSDDSVGAGTGPRCTGKRSGSPWQGEIIAMLRQSGRTWWCNRLLTHDSGFFLPEDDATPVGVLFAYITPMDTGRRASAPFSEAAMARITGSLSYMTKDYVAYQGQYRREPRESDKRMIRLIRSHLPRAGRQDPAGYRVSQRQLSVSAP